MDRSAFAASGVAVRRMIAAVADDEGVGGIGGRHLGGGDARKHHLKREHEGDDRAHGSFQTTLLTPSNHGLCSQPVS